MGKFKKLLNKFFFPLFNTRAAGIYMLLFAAAIGVATFIENDFGTSSAQKLVFKSGWFTLLLVLFAISIAVNIYRFRMIKMKKWTLLTFHAAMIIILIGAGVTRYFGTEGIMHIRENDSSNVFLSADTYLNFEVLKGGKKYDFNESVLFASLGNNNWEESYLIGKDLIEVKVEDFIPNPKQFLQDSPEGKPTIKVVIAGRGGREEYFISQGDSKRIRGLVYNFTDNEIPNAINIAYRNDSILIKSNKVLAQTVMATQTRDTLYPSNHYYPLRLRSLYSDGVHNFVFGDFKKQAVVSLSSENPKVKAGSMTALKIAATVNGNTQSKLVYGQKGQAGRPVVYDFNDIKLAISYGAKEVVLPFSIKLYDFIMDKYPGTNSASSYASEVQIIDNRNNYKEDYRIYMNHILDYGGYRFFQSSFDQDEQGTYLSVNHDFWGTWISYTGYILLTIGMLMALLFSKKSRFYQVSQKIKNMRAKNDFLLILILILASVTNIRADNVEQIKIQEVVSAEHAKIFSQLVVQDFKGRMKPLHTLDREVMRKLAKKESLYGLSADQIILGMFANGELWERVPMIKIGEHEELHKLLNVSGDYASYANFFAQDGHYVLRDEVRRAYGLQPIDRGVLEKELMKLDEKVNIASMVYSGRLFKIIPVPDDPNHTWVANPLTNHGEEKIEQPVADRFFAAYGPALRKAVETDDYTLVNKVLSELGKYQIAKGGAVVPSKTKINAEILLNKLNVFNRLALFYVLLGISFLMMLFLSVFKPNIKFKKAYQILFGLVLVGFLFHTIGLGLRWYVSGRAPWSNGYESMIYIAWTTTLAGVIFTRKSLGGLAATMVLASTVLLVAMLSYLDPEITPLVPVLKSYWLTIHVSLEAGSYGFLMLGAIIGLINLILMIFLTEANKDRIQRIVTEMSYISEMTLIGGLFMVSIGTYLGGVWANESWGRYWGWDAKETWALVTILVYAFILHMRLIPKMQGLYAYNFASIFGWASVLMTYFGVNYYLSGLHSYAAGDPVPIPSWVYYATASVLTISVLAYWKKNKFGMFS